MIGLDATQIATVIATILIIYFQVRQIRSNCNSWLWQLPLLIWMVHTLVFYCAIAFDTLEIIDIHVYSNIVFSIWSAILRLHGTFTILGLEYTRYRAVKEIKRYGS